MIQTFCCVCARPISEARAKKKAVTCSAECHKTLRDARRRETSQKKCPTCGAPSNEGERALFRQWRRSIGQEKKGRGRPRKTDWAKRLVALGTEWPEGAVSIGVFDASLAQIATVTREQFDKAKAATQKHLENAGVAA